MRRVKEVIMNKSPQVLEKEIHEEYRKNRGNAQYIVGIVMGIFGGLFADLFKDVFLKNNLFLQYGFLLLSGGITFWFIWYFDRKYYSRAYKLEKELKKLKKHKHLKK